MQEATMTSQTRELAPDLRTFLNEGMNVDESKHLQTLKASSAYREIYAYLTENNRTADDEYAIILEKKSKLSARCRAYIVDLVQSSLDK